MTIIHGSHAADAKALFPDCCSCVTRDGDDDMRPDVTSTVNASGRTRLLHIYYNIVLYELRPQPSRTESASAADLMCILRTNDHVDVGVRS